MKKRHLALLMFVPLVLLILVGLILSAENDLVSTAAKTREAVQTLKHQALHADTELNPQAQSEVLSKSLIGVSEAYSPALDSYIAVVRSLWQGLAWCAMLQIIFSIYVFQTVRRPNAGGTGPGETPKHITGA